MGGVTRLVLVFVSTDESPQVTSLGVLLWGITESSHNPYKVPELRLTVDHSAFGRLKLLVCQVSRFVKPGKLVQFP